MPVGTTSGKPAASDTALRISTRRPTPTGVHSTSAVTPAACAFSSSGAISADHIVSVGLGIAGLVPGAQVDEHVLVRQDHAEFVLA